MEHSDHIKPFLDIAGLGMNVNNMAGGSIVEDFDNDGYLDIVVSSMDPKAQLRFLGIPARWF